MSDVSSVSPEQVVALLAKGQQDFEASARRGNTWVIRRLVSGVRKVPVSRKGPGRPDFSLAEAWTRPDGSQLLAVPSAGVPINTSGMTVFILDAQGRLQHHTEAFLSAIDDRSGRGRFWVDGTLIMDKVADSDGNLSDPGDLQLASFRSGFVAGDWNKFKSCLNNQGVPSWAVVLIGAVCNLACRGGLFTCLACVLPIIFVASWVIGYCGAVAGYDWAY